MIHSSWNFTIQWYNKYSRKDSKKIYIHIYVCMYVLCVRVGVCVCVCVCMYEYNIYKYKVIPFLHQQISKLFFFLRKT